MKLSIRYDSKTSTCGYPLEPTTDLTGFSDLTRFGYEFRFSQISQHGYKMGNMDIGTHPERIPKFILNVENYFITY